MEINTTLMNQGFSPEEIEEMERMTSAVLLFLSEDKPTINWGWAAIFEADYLAYSTKSEKVRTFAIKTQNKLRQFL
jgi:hypothetical protein